MVKKKKHKGFYCKECGHESLQYLGKCPSCNAWDSLIKQPDIINEPLSRSIGRSDSAPVIIPKLKECSNDDSNHIKFSTTFHEFDRVLGGDGLTKGSFILLGGDPGIGKSTILLQLASRLSKEHSVLYISGEESSVQVHNRAKRLCLSLDFYFLAEIELNNILNAILQSEPDIVIIDSIQSINESQTDSFPGSSSQVRIAANAFLNLAKQHNITIIIIGHITKDGNIAGPKLLEHMVDVVLYFEGERDGNYRMLRSIKNRFGAVGELGMFEMKEAGLIEVENASAIFLGNREISTGSMITASTHGNRVLLAEIQSLVGFTAYPQPRRVANGLDYNRLSQIIAIIERRVGISLAQHDVYTGTLGGIVIKEPVADLAIALSIISCAKDKVLDPGIISLGELSLSGALHTVSKTEDRLKEADRLGFQQAIIPAQTQINTKFTNLKLIKINKLKDILTLFD